MESVGVIGGVGRYCRWIVIDTRDYLSTLLAMQPGLVYSRGGSAGTTKEVNV